MRRLAILVVAAVLGTAGVASAQRARAAVGQPTKAARAKTPAAKPTKPAPRAFKAKPVKAEPGIPKAALLTQYQRVGRELILLSNDRGAKIGVETEDAKTSCAELQAQFRSIKLDEAVATPESRAQTAELLQELHTKIERLRGVALSQECLTNPLARDCT